MMKISRIISYTFLLYVNKRETLPIKQGRVITGITDAGGCSHGIHLGGVAAPGPGQEGPYRDMMLENYSNPVSVGEDSFPVSLRGYPVSGLSS